MVGLVNFLRKNSITLMAKVRSLPSVGDVDRPVAMGERSSWWHWGGSSSSGLKWMASDISMSFGLEGILATMRCGEGAKIYFG